MDCQFGYNCKFYLPSLNKCRKLVDNYIIREDLVEKKWLSFQDIMVYLGLSNEELMKRITTGEIKAKPKKDGKIIFQVSSAWQWDDCPLTNDGGQCFYFEAHDGKKISCLAELRKINEEHPNTKTISEEEIHILETEIMRIIGSNLNIHLNDQ